jgi:hypothetical protein
LGPIEVAKLPITKVFLFHNVCALFFNHVEWMPHVVIDLEKNFEALESRPLKLAERVFLVIT